MRAKDRHIKPHFTVNGQIWFVEKDLDPREFEFSPDPAIRAWFGPDQMRHLISVYEWWKRKDASSARITDAMLIRHCDSYQLIDGRGKTKYRVVHRPDIPVFIRYPDSRHSKNWRDRTVPHLKKDERMSVDMMLRSGYCRTSNNHLIISRIDCPDWGKSWPYISHRMTRRLRWTARMAVMRRTITVGVCQKTGYGSQTERSMACSRDLPTGTTISSPCARCFKCSKRIKRSSPTISSGR